MKPHSDRLNVPFGGSRGHDALPLAWGATWEAFLRQLCCLSL